MSKVKFTRCGNCGAEFDLCSAVVEQETGTSTIVLCPECGWDHCFSNTEFFVCSSCGGTEWAEDGMCLLCGGYERREGAVLNLTQHDCTEDQKKLGVFEPKAMHKERIKELLTFNEPPIHNEKVGRAENLLIIAQHYNVDRAMIGGAPFFMSILEKTLDDMGITPLYAFSKRVVEEQVDENGEVRKVARFKCESLIP